MNLKKRIPNGAPLTWEDIDNNWQLIEDYCNNNLGPRIPKTVTLVIGDNEVVHASGKKPYDVKFFLSTGQETRYDWVRKPDDQMGAIIVKVPADTPADELANTEINILV